MKVFTPNRYESNAYKPLLAWAEEKGMVLLFIRMGTHILTTHSVHFFQLLKEHINLQSFWKCRHEAILEASGTEPF